MKAIVWTKYGSPDGLQLQEIENPVPKDNEILVRVRATTVTAGDCEMRRLQLPLMLSLPMRLYAGLIRPTRITVLGQELAGEVTAVGQNVPSFKTGDPVFGTTGFGFGAYAEYICLKATPNETQGSLAGKPANMSYEEAAAVPTAGFEALHFLRQADVQPGQKVLVFGAGGSIGTFAVQLAHTLGAAVTAVDSAPKLAMLRSIGADHVIDSTRQDFTQNGETYAVIIDVVGKKAFSRRLKSLQPDGHYFLANAGLSHLLRGWWTSMTSSKKVVIGSSSQTKEDLLFLKDLIEAGKLKSVIDDRRFALAQIPEAHRYAETGRKIGNIVITVGEDNG
ncbi:MAG: NAD(P)-dependent alcohol dehydrogenase [Chloroflexi bacterium]|nr:NAD(P)-dependent alcohol dehydrogenase [Chloroflexota bacterium]MBP7042513.1 NAD(P)-dependent alcohol dehydrogenase [Chloroflexota bacterium]